MSELKDLRIVITRPEKQAQSFREKLDQLGAETILIPAIKISFPEDNFRLDKALGKLDCYEWLILTSVNGVKAVWQRLQSLGVSNLPEQLQVAAIGPKTAEELIKRGVQPDFVPEEYIAEAILPGLGDINGNWVLLARAKQARPALARLIQDAGGFAHEITAYDTVPGHLSEGAVEELKRGVDVLTFTSSSTVNNFISLAEEAGLDPGNITGDPLVACIGPITAETAQEKGFEVDVIAEDYTIEGLTSSLIAHYHQRQE